MFEAEAIEKHPWLRFGSRLESKAAILMHAPNQGRIHLSILNDFQLYVYSSPNVHKILNQILNLKF